MPRIRKHPRTKKTGVKKIVGKRRSKIDDVIQLRRPRFIPRTSFPLHIKPGFLIQHSGLVFILVGALLLMVPRVYPLLTHQLVGEQPETENAVIPDTEFKNSSNQKQTPVQIVIPSIKIDLPITMAKINRGVWETSETTASFGDGSAIPEEKGNTVIFAHARENLFLPLKEIKLHDSIYVFTKDTWYTYEVDEIKEVKPKDVYVVKPTEDKRLTLFTCSGFLDSRRLVVVAKPQ